MGGGSGVSDYKCDLDCPVKTEVPVCCRDCAESHGDGTSHWTKTGCDLTRDQMPKECIRVRLPTAYIYCY